MNISSFNQELSRVVEGRFSLPSRYQWRRYSVAVLAVAICFAVPLGIALCVKLLLNSVIEKESPFLVFFGAVLLSARYGGTGAGVLATFLAACLSVLLLSISSVFIYKPRLGAKFAATSVCG